MGATNISKAQKATMEDQEVGYLSMLEANKDKILRICSVYARDEEEHKDLFQEVLLQLWKSFASFRGDAKLSTWVYRVSLNTCLQHRFRGKNKHAPHKIEELEWIKPASAAADERLDDLRQCIRKLGEADRVLVMLYLEDLPYKEIAETIGISENLVAVKMKRIRTKLFHCITEKI